MPIDLDEQRKARAKKLLVQLVEPMVHIMAPYRERKKFREALLRLYNRTPELARVYEILGHVNPDTLRRWGKKFYSTGTDGLINGRGRPSGSAFPPAMKAFVRDRKAASPDISAAAIHRLLHAEFEGEKIPSKTTVRRWVNDPK